MVANLLEAEYQNGNPKLTYVLQSANTEIEPEYWYFTFE